MMADGLYGRAPRPNVLGQHAAEARPPIDDHLNDGSRHSSQASTFILPGRTPGRPRNPA